MQIRLKFKGLDQVSESHKIYYQISLSIDAFALFAISLS